jgi:hypothetical protein
MTKFFGNKTMAKNVLFTVLPDISYSRDLGQEALFHTTNHLKQNTNKGHHAATALQFF